EVVVAETETAKLNASLAEKQLESTVLKPADAEAYKRRTLAQAARDAQIAAAEANAREVQLRGEAQAKATELTGKAEAAAVQAKAMAEAAGIKARAEALATNTDAVVAQQLAEAYPEIVAAAASSFEKVGNMVVLNGRPGARARPTTPRPGPSPPPRRSRSAPGSPARRARARGHRPRLSRHIRVRRPRTRPAGGAGDARTGRACAPRIPGTCRPPARR